MERPRVFGEGNLRTFRAGSCLLRMIAGHRRMRATAQPRRAPDPRRPAGPLRLKVLVT